METLLQFLGYLTYDSDINLMVQKIVNLQDITLLDDSIAQNLCLEKIHVLLCLWHKDTTFL